jgi:hypothetical protein
MRRFWISLLSVGLTLVIALPAGAGKPDKPSPDEPLVGLTCDEARAEGVDFVDGVWNDEGTEFTVVLGARARACVDVLSDAGDWTVEVEKGSAIKVGVEVQDSTGPGDTCWDQVITKDGIYEFSTPASTLNACDDAAMDPEPDFGDEDEQLAFGAWASYHGKAATPATITVTLPQP